ncbi:MAG: class I SAM-dependent methyltransferase [Anaerolineaceae bacterium]|nr:class I SAM-dependent methyltransferase [Anaerolineaceae bacterium]MDE0329315.1 class I SAM-dependent methyltransferase [Anaerolineaceae bacterium]
MSDSSAATPGVDPETVAWMLRNEADMSFRMRARTVFEWVPLRPDSLILDLPCGQGFYLKMLRHISDCPLLGLDLDAAVLKKAQGSLGRAPGLLLGRSDALALPLPPDCVDAIILTELLEHVRDDLAVLRECQRVLKPGGVMAITVPHANYPLAWDPINKTLEKLFGLHIRSGPLAGIWANHLRLYTPGQLRERVHAAGLQVDEERSLLHHAFPFSHNLVYGLGKPLLQAGLLPEALADVADRSRFARVDGSPLNPLRLALHVLEWFDRNNAMDEAPGRSTVNLALRASKPL